MTSKKKKAFMEMSIDEKIFDRIGTFQVPYTQSKEEAFLQLKNKIAEGSYETPPQTKFRIRPVYWMSSAAAILFVLMCIWYGFFYKPVIQPFLGLLSAQSF